MQTLPQTSLITEEPTPPKGMKWLSKHRCDDFLLNKCECGTHGNDLWFKLSCTDRRVKEKPVFFVVRDFAGLHACMIEIEICLLCNNSACPAYPIGRNFHDCLMDACAWGIKPGYGMDDMRDDEMMLMRRLWKMKP